MEHKYDNTGDSSSFQYQTDIPDPPKRSVWFFGKNRTLIALAGLICFTIIVTVCSKSDTSLISISNNFNTYAAAETIPPEPTMEPTMEPVAEPTMEPAVEPTIEPAVEPTIEPAAEPTIEPAVEPEPSEGLAETKYRVVADSYLRLRKGPSVEDDILMRLPYGCEVVSEDRADERGWMPVRVEQSNRTEYGYVFSAYLVPNS